MWGWNHKLTSELMPLLGGDCLAAWLSQSAFVCDYGVTFEVRPRRSFSEDGLGIAKIAPLLQVSTEIQWDFGKDF